MTDHPTAPVQGDDALSAPAIFDMGYEWAMSLRGQTLEDSRAVGRTLFSDTFAAIADHIDTDDFNSFENADLGICAAKKIIHAALRGASRLSPTGLVEAPEAMKALAAIEQSAFVGITSETYETMLVALQSIEDIARSAQGYDLSNVLPDEV